MTLCILGVLTIIALIYIWARHYKLLNTEKRKVEVWEEANKPREVTNDERLKNIEGHLRQIAFNTNETRRNTFAIVVAFIIVPILMEACRSS